MLWLMDGTNMGCDIHAFWEQRIDGHWTSIEPWVRENDRLRVPYKSKLLNGRNYDLFAILANVRNGRGTAGCKTGEGYNPISEPRGVPDDCDTRIKSDIDSWGGDGHSHSYFTARELLDFDWNQKTERCGYIQADAIWVWENGWDHFPHCGDAFGGSIKKIPIEELKRMVADKEDTSHHYSYVRWSQYYHQTATELFKAIVIACHKAKPEDVRVVFFFDN
jgi:hypothetical protein